MKNTRALTGNNRIVWISLLCLVGAVAVLAWIFLQPRTQSISSNAIQKGNHAPDFSITDIQGNRVSLSDYKGREVLVNFWASWCGPCVKELPLLDQADARLRSALPEGQHAVLAINVGESRGTILEFIQDHNIQLPIGSDVSGEAATRYRVRSLPGSFLIDSKGRIKEIFPGEITSVKDVLDAFS